jgi:hypothetical protein
MTAKKVSANARNRKLACASVAAAARERIRAAHLRLGFSASAEEVALRALGEDPARFQELLEGLWETYQPSDAVQEGLVIHLARVMWLLNRVDRMQEGYAVRQAQELNSGRQDRLHARMMRVKMTQESLQLLAQAVAHEHYVTTPAHLEMMKGLRQEGVVKEMGEIALALFYQLRLPGAGEDGLDPEECARRMVAQAKEIFGIGKCSQFSLAGNGRPEPTETEDILGERKPKFTAAEWEARERPRQLLGNILKRQVEICEAQRSAALKESVQGPSPYERAAEIALTHPGARLLRGMQESYFREVRRITNLLLKLKRHERRMQKWEEKDDENDRSLSRDVREK